jgi:hypothetical protein
MQHGPFEREEKRLRIFGRRILREMYSLEEVEGIQHLRYDHEL